VRHGKHNGWPFVDLSSHKRAATCHTELDGTFLLSLDKEWGFLLQLWVFSFFSRLLLSFRTRRFERLIPLLRLFLYGRSASSCCLYVYSVLQEEEHMNISALYSRALTFILIRNHN
jgi:hypothetical protein